MKVRDVETTLHHEKQEVVRLAALLDPRLRKVLVLGVVLAVFQQCAGST